MWKVPFLNLCFVLLVITLLAVQHSVSVFGPLDYSYPLADYALSETSSHALSSTAWKESGLGNGLWSTIGNMSDLWQRSLMIREWLLECETTYWERVQAVSGAQGDLVEAKFHVANAEIFAVALGQNKRARDELNRAESSLVEAQPLLEEKIRPSLEAIGKELETIKSGLGAMSAENSTRFEKIKSQLDLLIEPRHFTKV
jgi:hypothetical protein